MKKPLRTGDMVPKRLLAEIKYTRIRFIIGVLVGFLKYQFFIFS
jgi:hypothetical protein